MGLGVDFVFPLLQQEQEQKQEQEEEPPPKSIRRGCTRSLKFDIYTTNGLLVEFRGFGVERLMSQEEEEEQQPHQIYNKGAN